MTDEEFRNAFHQHKDVLYRYAYRMTGLAPVSEDVVQEVFLALWRKPERYDWQRGSLRSFLLGIARNLILKRWRDERPTEQIDSELFISLPLDLTDLERSEAVARAVQELPPLQREAVILAEYEEMPLQEIAAATGAELAAVKSRLHRGRENLKRLLTPLLEPGGILHGH